MSQKTLKIDNIRLDKKEFHKSKQPINLEFRRFRRRSNSNI